MTAYDKDELSEPISYSISGDGSQYFSLEATTGKLTVADNTGLIAGQRFTLQVQVKHLVFGKGQ